MFKKLHLILGIQNIIPKTTRTYVGNVVSFRGGGDRVHNKYVGLFRP